VEEASIRPAQLVEGKSLESHGVGSAEPCDGPVAFLDGIQRYHIVAHLGAAPLVIATISAAVRERRERELHTAAHGTRALALGRAEVLAQAGEAIADLEQIALPDGEPVHPVRDLAAVRRAVDSERGKLELSVGSQYRRPENGWLVVDGGLSESPAWAANRRTIGIVKSHSILPFSGEELERYLHLPCGHRTSGFAPASRQVAPVYSWALRLWPWEGKDLFYGLIRVEVAPGEEAIAEADRISRWILSERAPVSAPDSRWDRLLYGIRDVEVFLRAT
jgi:hypothetical protein